MNDALFLFTDGLTEGCPDSAGRTGHALHGLARLRECLSGRRPHAIQEVVDGTVDELLDRRGHTLDDDVVLLGIEF